MSRFTAFSLVPRLLEVSRGWLGRPVARSSSVWCVVSVTGRRQDGSRNARAVAREDARANRRTLMEKVVCMVLGMHVPWHGKMPERMAVRPAADRVAGDYVPLPRGTSTGYVRALRTRSRVSWAP